jgi:predicted MPP superfamily phosphohydrolase
VDAATGLNLELTAELAAQDKPAFIVITGELVGENNTQNITRLLDILNKMPAPVFVAYSGEDESLRTMFGPLPRVFTYGEYVFLLAAPGQSRTKTCAEQPIRDLLKDNQDRQIELRLFDKSNNSLYFDADGNTSVIIPNPHDDDCLKAVQETVAPALFTGGAIRVFTYQDGKIGDTKTVTIPR